MAFFKFLFITLAVVWFVGLIFRAVFARWLRKNVEAYNDAAARAKKEAQRQAKEARRKEGQVTVEKMSSEVEKRVARGMGEYVEFEEYSVEETSIEKE